MRRIERDEGAVAVMVAIVVVVLIGFAAIVIDVGSLYFERRQLQNGADAAALAVAQDCASGATVAACDGGPQGDRFTTAKSFADANANDGAASVSADPTGVDVDFAASEVTVTATTLDGGTGEGFIRHWFAPVLGIDDPTKVGAQSTAIWGPVALGSLNTIPLAISTCEYDKYFAGADYAASPWTVANNGDPQVLYFHGKAESCHDSPSGQDLPGGFGWLESTESCEADIQDGWVDGDTGTSAPKNCSAEWMAENVYNKVLRLVVFRDCARKSSQPDECATGSNAAFDVSHYAALYVTGYHFGGQYTKPSKKDAPCSGNDRCIAGWFTQETTVAGVVDLDAEDTGLRTVQLVR